MDPKYLNEAIKREYSTVDSFEEIANRLVGAEYLTQRKFVHCGDTIWAIQISPYPIWHKKRTRSFPPMFQKYF